MRILHVIPAVGPLRGGPSQAVLEIVKALREFDIEAEIVTTNDNGPELLNVPLCQRTEYQQVPIWFFPRFSPPIKPLWEFAFSSQLTTWLWQHITDYDLVHIHAIFSYSCTVAMAICRLKNVPYIVRPNGLLCQWSLEQRRLKKQLYLALIEKANLKNSKALEFTSSQEQKEVDLLSLNSHQFILPYGLETPAALPDARQSLRKLLEIPQEQPIILFMSRLHYKKGLEYLIPALAKLSKQPFTFILAGNGTPTYETEIKELLHTSGIDNRTYYPGFVEGETKQLLLQGSDIFALTSHSESFGLAVLEAIYAGLDIITTPGVPLAPVVKQYQLGYVPELDINQIATALQQSLDALQNTEQNLQRRQRAHQLITEQYTWNKISENLIQIYKAILNKQSLSALY